MYTMYTTPVEKCHKALFYVGCGCVHFRVIRCTQDVHRMYTHVHTLMYFGHKTARKSGNLRVYMLWNGFGFSKGICPCFQPGLLECGESTLPSISNAPINSKGTLLHAKVPFVC